MAITIKDIAKKAGVSTATVSLVISNHPRISEVTKKRVRQIMDELQYKPNAIARSFVTKSLKTIGVVMNTGKGEAFRNPFFYETISGIESALREQGYYLLLYHWDAMEDALDTILNLWLEKRVDGFLLQYSDHIVQHLERLREVCLPFLMIGKPSLEMKKAYPLLEESSWADADNQEAGAKAMEYCHNKGCQKIAFVVEMEVGIQKERFLGAQNAKDEKIQLIQVHGSELIKAKDSANKLKELGSFDGVIFANHQLALKYAGFCKQALTFDNLPHLQEVHPRLVIIHLDVYQLGKEATSAILELLQDPKDCIQKILPLSEIVEKSTQGSRK